MTPDDVFGQMMEEISREFETLKALKPGTDEYAKVLDNVSVLYKLKNEEARISIEGEEKDARREMEQARTEREFELKEKQMNADLLHRANELNLEQQKLNAEIDHYTQELEVKKEENRFERVLQKVQLGTDVGKFCTMLWKYGRWFKGGLEFEKTGSYSSTTFRNFLSVIKPTKK